MSTPGARHPLLLYVRWFGMLRLPALLIAVLSAGLWWFADSVPLLANTLAQAALLTLSILCGLLFVYAWVGPRMSYVQCRPTHLRISTPLFRLAVSYSRIRTTKPVKFAPGPLPASQSRLVDPFRGQTIVAAEFISYPMSERWLRLWFSPFMFAKDLMGLQFIVTDWMALSREIDSYRSHWKTRGR